MRTSAHFFRFLLVAWLSLISMADLRSIPGFVLCFGEDGHIELEVAVNDRCGPETAHTGLAALVSGDADHCGECSDIPLFSESMQSHFDRPAAAPRPDFQPLGTPFSPFSSPSYAYALPTPTAWRNPPPPTASPSLISLRTIRILV